MKKIVNETFPDLSLFELDFHLDNRGSFVELFNKKRYDEFGVQYTFVQDNISVSAKNVIRGLHYQIVQPQGKLISVLEGEVFEAVVDMRLTSATFGKWASVSLSSKSNQQLWIPHGFANGFLAMSEVVIVHYKVTDYYFPEHERTLLWNDKSVDIKWPILENCSPIISEKDLAGKSFSETDKFN